MGRKTKKEKIIAKLRRENQALVGLSRNSPEVKVSLPSSSLNNILVLSAPTTERTDYSFLRADLTRTLLFTFLAIGAQLVLWYLQSKGLIRFF